MSDTGSSGDNKPQQHDEVNLASSAAVAEVENKPVTPAKRTPSKRVSAVERAQRESEELVKTLGGSLDIEGGRKTRSSTRGTPSRSNVVDTPPPTKKPRNTSGTPRRGRGRKLETTIEIEAKNTPEKISSKPESIEEEEENSAIDATKTDEKVADTESEANEIPPVEAKPSPVKADEKPEPMEVDGVDKKENITLAESEHVAESKQVTTVIEKNVENSKESEKILTEQQEESSSVEKDDPPTDTAPLVPVDEAKNSTHLENKNVENSLVNNIEINNSEGNANSSPAPTTPPPATAPAPPVTVAGNEHKAESNDFCEPKIASPPITANNDGATPQYLYLKNL